MELNDDVLQNMCMGRVFKVLVLFCNLGFSACSLEAERSLVTLKQL